MMGSLVRDCAITAAVVLCILGPSVASMNGTDFSNSTANPLYQQMYDTDNGGQPNTTVPPQEWRGCFAWPVTTPVGVFDCRNNSLVELSTKELGRIRLIAYASNIDTESNATGSGDGEDLLDWALDGASNGTQDGRESTIPETLAYLNSTELDVLDFAENEIEVVADGSFMGITANVVNASHNRLSKVTASTFVGLTVWSLDLSWNVITEVEPRAFNGANISVLNLKHNVLTALRPGILSGLIEARVNLQNNNISNVLQGAWDGTSLAVLRMENNPSICAIVGGRPICQCDGASPQDYSNMCVRCPATLRVDGVEWRGMYPEELQEMLSNLTESNNSDSLNPLPFSTNPDDLSALITELRDNNGNGTSDMLTSLSFSCGGGAVLGQECILRCRAGFAGRPASYTCMSNGQWQTSNFSNASAPTCVLFDGNLQQNQSEFINNTVAPREVHAATAGTPFLYPAPAAYGTDLQFDSFGLPRGIALDKNGQLIGIPTEPGNFSVTIFAVDTTGELIPAAAFLLVVAPPLSTSDKQEVRFETDEYVEYGASLEVVGGQPPFRFHFSGQLPNGMSLMPHDARPMVVGTPQQAGVYNAILYVTDGANNTAQFPSLTFIVTDKNIFADFKVQFFIAVGMIVLLIFICVAVLTRRHQEVANISTVADKVTEFERGMLLDIDAPQAPSRRARRRRRRRQASGSPPRPMRAMVLSHVDSLHEQKMALNELATVVNAAVDPSDFVETVESGSIRSGVSIQSVSSHIGRTGYEKCCVGTRIYRRDDTVPLDSNSLIPLEMFLAKAAFYSKHILIAAPLNDDNLCAGIEDLLRKCRTNARAGQDFSETELVKVPYWGKFTPPLNILLRHATLNHDKWLLFQSVEVLAEQHAVTSLLSHMDDNTLVAGLALENSHLFKPGEQPLTGLTCPWNTFAVWNVEKLGRTGFLPVSDGVPPLAPDAAGVEEVAAIALIQMLFPKCAQAKLVRLHKSLYTWDVDFKCEARLRSHEKKMKSKMDRPKRQLLAMGDIKPGSTIHIDMTGRKSRRRPVPLELNANSETLPNDRLLQVNLNGSEYQPEQQVWLPGGMSDTYQNGTIASDILTSTEILTPTRRKYSADKYESDDLGSPIDDVVTHELVASTSL